MVDLVKIRKKAKTKKDAAAAPPAESASPAAPAPPPARPPDHSRLEQFLATAGTRQVDVAKVDDSISNEAEVLTFIIAGELYAVDIEKIAEIVTVRPVTRVPNADRSVVGIFSLRGTIVTLIDVRSRLRHAPSGETTAESRVVVARLDGENIGFMVDRVLRVVKIDRAAVQPQPVAHASEQDESVSGVIRPAGALTILLDLDKLLMPALA